MKINNIGFDSAGIGENIQLLANSDYKVVGNYNLLEMKLAVDFGEWNEDYDRRDNPRMKKAINKVFKEILCQEQLN